MKVGLRLNKSPLIPIGYMGRRNYCIVCVNKNMGDNQYLKI